MIDFLDRIYTGVGERIFFSKTNIYSAQRFIIRILSNILIPILYQFGKKKYKLSSNNTDSPKHIVSLTSFPYRIKKVWIVIESILRQKHKPDKIIIWLSINQFESFGKLPKSLLNQQKRGLEIKFVDEDIKSHKKYYYALKEFPNDFLITIDDDIIYPTTLIGQLIELNKIYPTSICCHRAREIKFEGFRKKVLSYSSWEEIKHFDGPNYNVFFTSGGGTLFPPSSLHTEVLNQDIFKKYCFNADDVWLNVMSRLNSTSIVKSEYYSSLLPVVRYKDISLYKTNQLLGENDKQLKDVNDYYYRKLNINVFNIN